MQPPLLPLVAVDIGNSRIKFGLFETLERRAWQGPASLPLPARTFEIDPARQGFAALEEWLAPTLPSQASWWVASVQRSFTSRLLARLRDLCAPPAMLLSAADLPLRVELPRPDMVGIDRLAAALAAREAREPGRPAVVIDVGTAITVDYLDASGAFCGGAILPGLAMSARALHQFTDLLPLIEMQELGSPPPPLGTSTTAAMRAGLFWGAVGGIKELAARLAAGTPSPPQVFLTGGAAANVAALVAPDAQHVPHLTLAGIALAARAWCKPQDA